MQPAPSTPGPTPARMPPQPWRAGLPVRAQARAAFGQRLQVPAGSRFRLDGLQGPQGVKERSGAGQKAEQGKPTESGPPTGKPGQNQEFLASEPTLPELPAEPVPEPSTWLLLFTGLLALWLFHMRNMRNRGQGPKVRVGA